jgi:hypothetical protein
MSSLSSSALITFSFISFINTGILLLRVLRRRFDSGEKYRINKNLKLRKKEVFLRGTSCLYTYLSSVFALVFTPCLHYVYT